MKKLIIVRHGKSSWEDMSLADHDRPLNSRGHNDAPAMGRRMKSREIMPDLMVSSTARRAHDTCSYLAGSLGYPEREIQLDPRLYHASPNGILEVVRETASKINILYIFGHNPGFTDFANRLNNTYIDNIPTSGIVACSLDTGDWRKVTFGTGQQLFFDYPKKIKG